jgi:cyclopropane fatty-acyl-phospholipid synthase-like methyltransferase
MVFCGLKITDEEQNRLYQREYFFGLNYVDYIKERAALRLNFKRYLEHILRYTVSPKNSRLFEIGAAYGFFLEAARDEFCTIDGIDICADGCLYAQDKLGVKIRCGDFLETSIEKGRYDIFCMWDTIEHLTQPHLYIKKISETIKKEGIVAITTGDIDSLNARMAGKRWRLICPPAHLFYFSIKTISALLNRYGFEVLEVAHTGNYRTLGGMLLRRQNSIVHKMLKRTGIDGVPIYINMFDIMQVIARKVK